MCNITDNFMEDQIFYMRLKQERDHQMWCEYVEQREAEEEAYISQAYQYFKDLQEMESILPSIIEDEETIVAEPAIETPLETI